MNILAKLYALLNQNELKIRIANAWKVFRVQKVMRWKEIQIEDQNFENTEYLILIFFLPNFDISWTPIIG